MNHSAIAFAYAYRDAPPGTDATAAGTAAARAVRAAEAKKASPPAPKDPPEDEEDDDDDDEDSDDEIEEIAEVKSKKKQKAAKASANPDYLGMLPPSTQAKILTRLDRAAPAAPAVSAQDAQAMDSMATIGLSAKDADAFRVAVRRTASRRASTTSHASSPRSSSHVTHVDAPSGSYLNERTHAGAVKAAEAAGDAAVVALLHGAAAGLRTTAERDAGWATVRGALKNKASARAGL